jgi:hypothetical protein
MVFPKHRTRIRIKKDEDTIGHDKEVEDKTG